MQKKLLKISIAVSALAIVLFFGNTAEASLLKYYPNVLGTNWNQSTFTTTTDWMGIPARYAINYSSSSPSGAYLAGKPTAPDCLKLRSYETGQQSASSTRVIEGDGRYTDYYLAGSEYYGSSVSLGQSWGGAMAIALVYQCTLGSSEGANFSNGDLDLYIFDNPTDTIQSTSPPPPPSLQFLYPTNGGSTPLFSDYILSVAGLISANGYQVRLQSYVTDTATSTTKLTGARGLTDWTGFDYGTGADLMTNGVSIPRVDFGVDWADDNTMHVSAQLYATQHPTNPNADLANPILVTSTTIAFTIEAIPTNYGQYITPIYISSSTVSTSTRPIGAIENPLLSDASDCTIYPWTTEYTFAGIPFFATSSAERAICEGKKFINNTIADLGEFGNGQISDLTKMIQKVFPLNIFVHINYDIELARNATSTFDGNITLQGGSNVFMGRSITLINTSSTNAVLASSGGGPSGGFPVRATFDKILYLITGGIIILMSVRQIKSLQNA